MNQEWERKMLLKLNADWVVNLQRLQFFHPWFNPGWNFSEKCPDCVYFLFFLTLFEISMKTGAENKFDHMQKKAHFTFNLQFSRIFSQWKKRNLKRRRFEWTDLIQEFIEFSGIDFQKSSRFGNKALDISNMPNKQHLE